MTVGLGLRPVTVWLFCSLVGTLLISGCGTSSVDIAGDVRASTAVAASSYVFRVPSGSMEPTLPIGARVVVKGGPLTVAAIVVFHPPEGAQQQECGPTPHTIELDGAACSSSVPKEDTGVEFIKRVVAGPGDEIYVRGGHVYRKTDGSGEFVREQDSYIRACGISPECNLPTPIEIPAGQWFMMGDNRGESDDSRFYGPVPTAWVVGVAADRVLRPRYTSPAQ